MLFKLSNLKFSKFRRQLWYEWETQQLKHMYFCEYCHCRRRRWNFYCWVLFSNWYKKVCTCKISEHFVGCKFEQKLKVGNDLFFFKRHGMDTVPENLDHYHFVQVDLQVNLDIDKLLKSFAFLLGNSWVGIVYVVVLEDGRTLAVRRLGDGGSKRFKVFQNQIEAIGKMRHPNVNLLAYCWSVDEKLLIYDYILLNLTNSPL